MSAQILDGKVLASQLKGQLHSVLEDSRKLNRNVSIISITVGQDPSAFSYLKSQKKTAQELGIEHKHEEFSITTSYEETLEVIAFIKELNIDPSIHGVIINKPLPSDMDYSVLVNHLNPSKDIEGLGETNMGRLLLGKNNALVPCTAAAAVALLKSSNVNLQGKQAVIIGRSEIVGKPVALLLLKENMTVTICHSKTQNLEEHVQKADVVVAAIGQKRFVQGSWLKPGAIVIDVGINEENGKIVGDVDFESCKEKASFISPVPGGVGPVTAVMLMKNALEAFKRAGGV